MAGVVGWRGGGVVRDGGVVMWWSLIRTVVWPLTWLGKTTWCLVVVLLVPVCSMTYLLPVLVLALRRLAVAR